MAKDKGEFRLDKNLSQFYYGPAQTKVAVPGSRARVAVWR